VCLRTLPVMAALPVEPAVASSPLLSLMVEHLKVMAASRACFRILISRALSDLSLLVEHLKVMAASRACLRILNSRAPAGPYGRADGGLNSRACLRILPVLDAYWVAPLK